MNSFHNTTDLHGPTLKRREFSARSEEQRTLDFMIHHRPKGMTRDEVWEEVLGKAIKKYPNAGRVLTNLFNRGDVVKAGKRDGLTIYKLAPKGPVQTEMRF